MQLFVRSTSNHLFYFSVVLICMLFASVQMHAQHYWNQSFNEESSMLAGAVVGGGSGISAIYYNPASISDADYSQLSLNASLFSLEQKYVRNALGNGVDLDALTFRVQPRFISYIIKPKKKKLYIELASMNKFSNKLTLSNSVDEHLDIIRSLPGNERYIASYRYELDYNDYWIGMGASYKISEMWSVGGSVFASFKSLYYRNIMSMKAYPLSDTVVSNGESIPFYVASADNNTYVHYNNYRAILKLGLSFRSGKWSAGINITLPSINVYTDGKEVAQEWSMQNINHPDGSGFLPNVLLVDNQIKDDVKVNEKDPFSVAAGLTYCSVNASHTFYLTAEWFAAIKAYKTVETSENLNIGISDYFDGLTHNDWMSYVSASRSIMNVAVAYRWAISQSWLVMGGFKTDLNAFMGADLNGMDAYNQYANIEAHRFHITGGARFNLFKHQLFAGLQYTHGQNTAQKQIVNFRDPVEYNINESAPLQGDRQNNMSAIYNGLSLFLGATFNFGGGRE